MPRSGDVLSFLFALALTVLTVYLTVIGPAAETALEAALGRLLFAGLSLWAGSISFRWLFRLREKKPRLAITAEGIVDRTSLGPPVFIPWDQIKSVQVPSNGTLEVEVQDPGSLRLNLQRRFLTRFLRKAPETHVVIGLRPLSVPASDIIGHVISHHEGRMVAEVRAEKGLLSQASASLNNKKPTHAASRGTKEPKE